MATKEEQQRILDEMQEAQKRQREVSEKTGMAPRGGKSAPKASTKKSTKQKPEMSVDERVAQLEAQLKEAKKQKADLADQLNAKQSYDQFSKEQKAVSDIVRNNDDYHFVKEYTIENSKGEKNKIYVKMHSPSVIEQAEIQQEYVKMTNGQGNYFTNLAQELFMAIAYYRVVGDNVPEFFTNVDNTYRIDVLLNVWNDYQAWLDRFLDTKLQ